MDSSAVRKESMVDLESPFSRRQGLSSRLCPPENTARSRAADDRDDRHPVLDFLLRNLQRAAIAARNLHCADAQRMGKHGEFRDVAAWHGRCDAIATFQLEELS